MIPYYAFPPFIVGCIVFAGMWLRERREREDRDFRDGQASMDARRQNYNIRLEEIENTLSALQYRNACLHPLHNRTTITENIYCGGICCVVTVVKCETCGKQLSVTWPEEA